MQRTLLATASALVLSYSTLALAQPEPPPPPPPEPPAEPPAAEPPAEPPAAEPPAEPPPAEPPAEPPPAPPPETMPLPPPAPPPPPPPPPPTKTESELPTKIHVGKEGFFQPSANLQFWAVRSQKPIPGDDKATFMFRLRRAELKMKGEIVPKLVGYAVMIDPAKVLEFNNEDLAVDGGGGGTVTAAQPQSKVSVLQDFMITFLTDYADVSVGQFKIPVSYEGYNSATKLVFPERALSSRRWGDKRDIGIRAEKKLGDYFFYSLGLFNGSGLNRPDDNNQKDAALRVEAYPIDGVMVGAVGYAAIGQRDDPGTKDRVEGDVRVELANFLFQGEYIRAWDGPSGNRLKGHGMYGAIGYTFMDRMQPVIRVGYIDPDLDRDGKAANDEVFHYEVGFNYYLRKHQMKLQLAYSVFDPEGLKPGNEAIAAAQVSF